MESVIRDVRDLVPDERQVVESMVGHGLAEDQRILVVVLPSGTEPDDGVKLRAREEFLALCKFGTENRERLGISVEDADLILDEALMSGRAGMID